MQKGYIQPSILTIMLHKKVATFQAQFGPQCAYCMHC